MPIIINPFLELMSDIFSSNFFLQKIFMSNKSFSKNIFVLAEPKLNLPFTRFFIGSLNLFKV